MITDAYKISMGLAGFPLRTETFYFSFRKGGRHHIPFDGVARVKNLLEEVTGGTQDADFFDRLPEQYQLSPLMLSILSSWDALQVSAAPQGSWVYEREPIISITGPSFLVSVLEPLVLQLAHEIQVATAFKRDGITEFTATTPEGAESLQDLGEHLKAGFTVNNRFTEYRAAVAAAAKDLAGVVNLGRTFEVGLRAATNTFEHRAALDVLAGAGVAATSNTESVAWDTPWSMVGTMGHEHVQRFGDDLEAFRAMRDRFLGAPSYLLDTHDTLGKGIPAALQAVREHDRPYSIRYDSGDILAQFVMAESMFKSAGVRMPVHIIEDGLTPERVRLFEGQRKLLGIPEERVHYGLGGYFISHLNPYSRNKVSAVYKLSESNGRPSMKFGNDSGLGKQSVPGKPVIFRRLRGVGPEGIIGQAGEEVPEHYYRLTDNPEGHRFHRSLGSTFPAATTPYTLSPETQAMVHQLEKEHI